MIKRLMPWMIMMLTSVTLITLAAFLLWHFLVDERLTGAEPSSSALMEPMSAKEISELTVEIDNYMTNLANMNYLVRLSFSFVLENKQAKEELELMLPSVKSVINRTLADTHPEDLTGSEGMDQLGKQLKDAIDQLLTKGKLREVQITERLITVQH